MFNVRFANFILTMCTSFLLSSLILFNPGSKMITEVGATPHRDYKRIAILRDVPTPKKCSEECNAMDNCLQFKFFPSRSECELYGLTV